MKLLKNGKDKDKKKKASAEEQLQAAKDLANNKEFQAERLRKEKEASRPTNRISGGPGTGGTPDRITPHKKLKPASKKLIRKSKKMNQAGGRNSKKLRY